MSLLSLFKTYYHLYVVNLDVSVYLSENLRVHLTPFVCGFVYMCICLCSLCLNQADLMITTKS